MPTLSKLQSVRCWDDIVVHLLILSPSHLQFLCDMSAKVLYGILDDLPHVLGDFACRLELLMSQVSEGNLGEGGREREGGREGGREGEREGRGEERRGEEGGREGGRDGGRERGRT